MRNLILTFIVCGVAIGIVATNAEAGPVDPTEVDVTLTTGVAKDVYITVTPPINGSVQLDLMLLLEMTGSFASDLATLKGGVAEALFDKYNPPATNRFGVATYSDKPIFPFGNDGIDFVYETNQALTGDKTTFLTAVSGLTAISGGGDNAEGQLEALMQAALRTIEVDWDPTATKYVVVTTDSLFHVEGDYDTTTNYASPPNPVVGGVAIPDNDGDTDLKALNQVLFPAHLFDPGTGEDYPNLDQLRNALLLAGIVPIFAVKEFVSEYEDLVEALGLGSVVALDDFEGLVEAIDLGLLGARQNVSLVELIDLNDYLAPDGIDPGMPVIVNQGGNQVFKVTLYTDDTTVDPTMIVLRSPGFGDVNIYVNRDRPNDVIPEPSTMALLGLGLVGLGLGARRRMRKR